GAKRRRPCINPPAAAHTLTKRWEGGLSMQARRLAAVYAALLAGFAVVLCRPYLAASNTGYAARAAGQSAVTLRLPARRGNFYDCDGLPLTGLDETWYACACRARAAMSACTTRPRR